MTLQEHTSTRDLIGQIEAKDRKFRVAWVVFIFLILLVLIAVATIQLRTLTGVQEQLRQQKVLLEAQKASTDELKKNTTEQLGIVSSQLDCIANFFATRDRAEAIITDLEQCRIVREDGTIIAPTFTRGAAPQQTPTAQPGQPQTQPQAINPNSPGLTPIGPPIPETPAIEPPTDKPVEILGIPVCLPFTNVCIR